MTNYQPDLVSSKLRTIELDTKWETLHPKVEMKFDVMKSDLLQQELHIPSHILMEPCIHEDRIIPLTTDVPII